MADTSKYFNKKKKWSEVKDNLLGYYLNPYFAKLLKGGPLTYIDCFAGKGAFDDGKPGSPLIAMDILEKSLQQTTSITTDVKISCIELHYYNDLIQNISSHPLQKFVTVKKGSFLTEIKSILKDNENRNLFLYIDPFGIKDLSFSLFDELSNHKKSIELLINFNTFGFLREACRIMKLKSDLIKKFDEAMDDDMFEDDFYKDAETESRQSEKLNEIAGGNYWLEIIDKYKEGVLTFYEAEQKLAIALRKRFRENYKYVIDLPIKNNSKSAPKYRMIHTSNHEDGCYLMYENISKRWDDLTLLQSGGQLSLFEANHSEYNFNLSEVEKFFIKHIKILPKGAKINEIYATFCTQKGILCKLKHLQEFIESFEKKKLIKLKREPQYTKTGQETSFMRSSRNQKIWLD